MADLGSRGERILNGIPASRGVCRGKLFVLRQPTAHETPQYRISVNEVDAEYDRLQQALLLTRQQLHDLQHRVSETLGSDEARIFDAQLLVLEDPSLIDEVRKAVGTDHVNIDHAFARVAQRFIDGFAAMDDDYMRERAIDIRDVTHRVLQNLASPGSTPDLSQIREPSILVAHDLTPSQTALLDRKMILGFATDLGSSTSHTAILARALSLPAVTGLKDASQRVVNGEYALLDGFNGALVLHPSEQTLFEYGQIERRYLAMEEKLRQDRELPAVTLDRHEIVLSANIENAGETSEVLASGAEGVGLFRTEYLFLERATHPSEEEQYTAYRQLAERLHPAPVIIRTLDLGGDKMPVQPDAFTERNPFLGWRAIRLCLQERDLFRAQLRAILRAAVTGNIKMMYPMISSLDELGQANELVAECKASLAAEGIPYQADLEIGVMVEIPSAVIIADSLARHLRFFSIGTNDLIQYTLAVDRMNPKIAHLHQPTHPAVVRMIKATIDASHQAGIWTGVCGEMAGDPVLAPLLLGLGADELSVSPSLLPSVKYVLRRLKLSEARELAYFALQSESASEILERCRKLVRSIAPELLAC
ncbi:MAG: phosphoenolpyruvate--protein phosphotransferase [Verrucomicrobiales bacterium]|nr:phosphoenolpyruvate--protein phosphotransferase [Verrucomicrobiales bacterium]